MRIPRSVQGCASTNARAAVQDCFFLVSVTVLSLVLYVNSLGFYSDDWGFLALLNACPRQSFFGVAGCLWSVPDLHMRPIQLLCLAGLYRLFGLEPLAYHLF